MKIYKILYRATGNASLSYLRLMKCSSSAEALHRFYEDADYKDHIPFDIQLVEKVDEEMQNESKATINSKALQ